MSVRPSAVAGQFYPAQGDDLRTFISQALAHAPARPDGGAGKPKAIIVPHAGYIYSGITAACAYATLDGTAIERVVALGPAHRVPFYGMALPDADAFATPLGDVALDREGMELALAQPQVAVYGAAHALEHSLEVQLPFLQMTLGDFELVPLCVGSVDAGHVALVIEQLWGGEETLFVISSDLSHFHPYNIANDLDRQTIELVLSMQAGLAHDQACGATPVNAMMIAAKRHGLQVELLDYRNSGDSAGDKASVVGYAAFALGR
jgi:AmmeMemoRadiSam system protein B